MNIYRDTSGADERLVQLNVLAIGEIAILILHIKKPSTRHC